MDRFLDQLLKQGFKVRLIGFNKLQVAPRNRLTPELEQWIRQHKPQLIQALLQRQLQPECLYRSPDGYCLFFKQHYLNADYKPRCKDLCNPKSFRCPLDCQKRSKGPICIEKNEPPTEDELFKKCVFIEGTPTIH